MYWVIFQIDFESHAQNVGSYLFETLKCQERIDMTFRIS